MSAEATLLPVDQDPMSAAPTSLPEIPVNSFNRILAELSLLIAADPIASGQEAIEQVEEGDGVIYKNEGQPRRKQPLEVVRITFRSSRSGDERKEMELHGNRGGRYLMTFSLTDLDPFDDALHVNLSDATIFYPEEFHLVERT